MSNRSDPSNSGESEGSTPSKLQSGSRRELPSGSESEDVIGLPSRRKIGRKESESIDSPRSEGARLESDSASIDISHEETKLKDSRKVRRSSSGNADLSSPPDRRGSSRTASRRNHKPPGIQLLNLPNSPPTTGTPLTPSPSSQRANDLTGSKPAVRVIEFETMKDEELRQLLIQLQKDIVALEGERKRLEHENTKESEQIRQIQFLVDMQKAEAEKLDTDREKEAPKDKESIKQSLHDKQTPRTKSVKALTKQEIPLVAVSSLKRTSGSPLFTKAQKTQRELVALEIMTSEQIYVTNLRILVNGYFVPLRDHAAQHGKFSEEAISSIFGNIYLIFQMADGEDGLCKLLEDRFATWDPKNDSIGQVFEKWCQASMRGPYATYVSNYDASTKHLSALLNTNHHFNKLFHQIDEHVFFHTKLHFSDLHICPVQRFPRYCLLVKDLQKHTPSSHADSKMLTEAAAFFEESAAQINAKKAETEVKSGTTNVFTRFERLAKDPAETLHPVTLDMSASGLQRRDSILRNVDQGRRAIRKRLFIKSGKILNVYDFADIKKNAGKSKKGTEILLFNDILVATAFIQKKNPSQEYYQPTSCLWIERDPGPEVFARFDSHDFKNTTTLCLVRGPWCTWILSFLSVGDKKIWVDEICKAAGISIGNDLGFRNGIYDFPKGSYDGNWFFGSPDGRGKLTTPTESFDGHWHSELKCGYGKYTDSKGTVFECGWKDHGDRVEAITWFWDNLQSQSILDAEDWRLILTGAQQVKKLKDEIVVEKGKIQTKLMKVKTGSLKVEVKKGVFQTIPSPFVLGDSSFIKEIKVANRTVKANEDCELEEVLTVELLSLFLSKPRLAFRFFRDKARKLALQLRNFNPDMLDDDDPEEEVAAERRITEASRFNLPGTEILQEEIKNVYLKDKITYEGTLYILTTCLVFEYSAFGLATQKVIYLQHTKTIKYNQKKFTLKLDKVKIMAPKDGKRIFDIITSSWEISRTKKKHVEGTLRKGQKDPEIILNERDKELMLGGAVEKHYPAGSTIIKEGDFSHRLFQVHSGTVQVKKASFSTTLGPGVIFGEISFLESSENAKATASVLAESDVVVYILEGWYVNCLFVDHPDMASKFYAYLCSTLARRLIDREQEAKKKEKN